MSEKEITRAEQERYDLETLARYTNLVERFEHYCGGKLGSARAMRLLRDATIASLAELLDKEGY